MTGILVMGASLLCALVLQQALTAACATAVGVPVERVRIFLGPVLWSTSILGLPFELGAVPTGGYVAFVSTEEGATGEGSTDALTAAPIWARLVVAFLPWAVLLLAAVVVLGPAGTLSSLAASWSQFLGGGLLFWSQGAQHLEELQRVLPQTTPVVVGATTLTKLVGINLLPSAGTSGGIALSALVPERWAVGLQALTAAIVGLCALGWLLALTRFVVF